MHFQRACILFIAMIISLGLSGSLFSAEKEKTAFPKQSGIGTVDTFVSHGNTVYRFVPDDKELRMVKFVPGQLGFKGNKLPDETDALLAKAMKEKLKIDFSCEYFDHGPGKTAIGKVIVHLKLAEVQ